MPRDRLAEGVKYDAGKLRYDLIPARPLEYLAAVYTFGASKYEDRNWEKGMPFSKIYGAIQRHLNAFWKGENLNPQDGNLPHLAQAAFGCFALLEYMETHPEMDNRPGRKNEGRKPVHRTRTRAPRSEGASRKDEQPVQAGAT